MAGRFSSKAGRTALGGVLAAGSLAVLWLLYGAGNLVFLLYDWGLSRLIGMMTARLKLR